MSDMMEKLLREEQDTGGKFLAAADFFMGLKGIEKEARYAKPKTVKVKKIKPQKAVSVKETKSVAVKSRAATKAAITRGGGTNVSLQGQASTPARKKKGKYKIVAPPKMTKVSHERKKEILKQAMIVGGLKNFGEVIKNTVKGGVGTVDDAAKAFSDGYKAPTSSQFGRRVSGLKNRLAGGDAGLDTIKGVNVGTKRSKTFQGFYDLFKSEAEVKRTQEVAKRLADMRKSMPDRKVDPEAFAAFKTRYNKAVADERKRLVNFRKGLDARAMTGGPETVSNIFTRVTGPDGKITPTSVLKGAGDMGLFKTENLLMMGSRGLDSLRSAQAARQAAKRQRMINYGIAGAGGLGTIALLKSSKKPNEAAS